MRMVFRLMTRSKKTSESPKEWRLRLYGRDPLLPLQADQATKNCTQQEECACFRDRCDHEIVNTNGSRPVDEIQFRGIGDRPGPVSNIRLLSEKCDVTCAAEYADGR